MYVNYIKIFIFDCLFYRLDICGSTKKTTLKNFRNLLIMNKIVADLIRRLSCWLILIIIMVIISSMYTAIKLNTKCGLYLLLGITITGFLTNFNTKLILQRAFIIYKDSCDFLSSLKNQTYLSKEERLRLKSYEGMYLYLFNQRATSDFFPIIMDKVVLSILTTLLLTFRN